IVLRDSDPVVLTHHHCTCVAGTALCSQLYCSSRRLSVPIVLPVHSFTEAEQRWHKPGTTGVKPGPINKIVISKPTPKSMAEGGVRSTLYKGMVGLLPDLSVLKVEETYRDFHMLDKPLVTTMVMTVDRPLVESAFGLVQKGSVLSYQQPKLATKHIKVHKDAPPNPSLPLVDY
ncbi:unnamed protein product, partial [Coregonus sp. 'balchen']